MKEVNPDSKWEDEGGSLGKTGEYPPFAPLYDPNDYEVEDNTLADYLAAVEPDEIELMTPPSPPTEDGQLAILTLLMRIYDVQMALLSVHDESTANEIYDAHEAGNSFNPPLYIPQFGVKTDAEDSD